MGAGASVFHADELTSLWDGFSVFHPSTLVDGSLGRRVRTHRPGLLLNGTA
jgi:hypothetical protein